MKKVLFIVMSVLLLAGIGVFLAYNYVWQPASKPQAEDYSEHTFGLDISHHNKMAVWKIIDKEGKMTTPIKRSNYNKPDLWECFNQKKQLNFVYIKATEGATFRDPMAKKHHAEAKKRNLKVGYYHFFSRNSSPQAQFKNFVNYAKDADLRPVIDFENLAIKMKTKEEENTLYKNLCALDELLEKKYGVKPIIYTNPREYDMFFKGNKKFEGRLWIPHWENVLMAQCIVWVNNVPLDFNFTKNLKQVKK